MQTCARFFRMEICRPFLSLVSLSLSGGAFTLRKQSSPCLQDLQASSRLPFSHSIMPSFLHFSPQFIALVSVDASATRGPSCLSCSSFFSTSSRARLFNRASYSAMSSSAAFSPSRSILFRSVCKVSRYSLLSTSSWNGTCRALARSKQLLSTDSTIRYLKIGVISLLTSFEQSLRSSAITSLLLLQSITLLYCASQVCRRLFQHSSVLRMALFMGFRAALYQNSSSCSVFKRFGLTRGSVLSNSI
mmetsp:Transcript_4585/g.8395  ORF Transcript_4585/g.8395 Transcript_4585/m.8395 type:complete len:246 (-) Transcript_4585:441-1178(-)